MNKRQAKKNEKQKVIDNICMNLASYGVGLGAVKWNPSKRIRKKCEVLERKTWLRQA